MQKFFKILAGLTLFAGFCSSASAQWEVFDPTNWVQNYATAVQTLEQYQQMIQQVQNSTQELSSLANAGPISNNAVDQLQGGIQTTNNLLSALGNGQNAAQNLVSAYGSSGTGSFGDWIASVNQQGVMQSQGVDALAQSAVASNQAVQDAQTQWSKANQQIAVSPGLHDQLQLVNESLMTLIQQNQATNQALAALAANEAQKSAQQNAQTMSGQQAADEAAYNAKVTQGDNWLAQTYGGVQP